MKYEFNNVMAGFCEKIKAPLMRVYSCPFVVIFPQLYPMAGFEKEERI